jgi:hypothetical protein
MSFKEQLEEKVSIAPSLSVSQSLFTSHGTSKTSDQAITPCSELFPFSFLFGATEDTDEVNFADLSSAPLIFAVPNTTHEVMTVFEKVKVPDELFAEVKAYLSIKDYWKFLNTSQKLFLDLKFSTRKISLPFPLSQKFIMEKSYASEIISKVQVPSNQLVLRILMSEYHSGLNILDGCDLILAVFQGCDISVFSTENVGRLFVNRFLISMNSNSYWTEFPQILNVHSMKIYGFSNLSNISSLSTLKSLVLRSCQFVQDVSCLKSLEHLTLSDCRRVEDVSMLGDIRYLDISRCERIEDITGLTNNYSLKISSPASVKLKTNATVMRVTELLARGLDFKVFEKISFPNLKNFGISMSLTRPEDISFQISFKNLYSLSICSCTQLVSLNYVAHIPILNFAACENLADISDLGETRNKYVSLAVCPKIQDFSSLKNIPKIHLGRCPGFTKASDVSNVHQLTIQDCRNFHDMKNLENVYHLILYTGYDSYEDLMNIPVLELNPYITLGKKPTGKFTAVAKGKHEKIIIPLLFWKPSFITAFVEFHLFEEIDSNDSNQNKMILLRKKKLNFS